MLGQEALSPNGGKLTYHAVVRAKIPREAYTVIGAVPASLLGCQPAWMLRPGRSCRMLRGKGGAPQTVHDGHSQALLLNPFHDDDVQV
jgi:hypothetical protein